ncbi:MAG: hypothetical protein BGO01_12280 [Armatimonadetes bacterium 55-13]|nr:MAG: hypothetical protein BGO01_12280 [Armatimonadetes bacterium 55-13]
MPFVTPINTLASLPTFSDSSSNGFASREETFSRNAPAFFRSFTVARLHIEAVLPMAWTAHRKSRTNLTAKNKSTSF